MRELLSSTAPAPGADDSFSYWRFRDLQARRIVSTRTDLHRKIQLFGFPKPLILTGGKGAAAVYRIDLVKAWLAAREALALQNAEPGLKPGSRRGRPRKDAARDGQLALSINGEQ